MSAHIFAAAVPEPYRIFCIELLPFSLGRYQLLRRFECAFVAEEETQATVEDLLLGLLVCSMRCREFLVWIQSKAAARELKAWGKRIRRQIKAEPHFNIYEKIGLFRQYLESSARVPKFWEEQSHQANPSGSHWSHSVEVTLRAELGYTIEQIEETPLGKALGDYFKWAESQGLITIMTEEQIADLERSEASATPEGNVTIDADKYLAWLKENAREGVLSSDELRRMMQENDPRVVAAAGRWEDLQNGS